MQWNSLLCLMILSGVAVNCAEENRQVSPEEKPAQATKPAVTEAPAGPSDPVKPPAANAETDTGKDTTVTANPTATAKIDPPAGMQVVPAGAFWMGCFEEPDAECDEDEKPAHQVTLTEFWIDTMEVSVAAYKACVQAGKCSPPGKRRGCNGRRRARGDHPINCVGWEQAQAYCRYVDKRLPTEAEWEKAARGLYKGRYPWGMEWANCKLAVVADPKPGCGKRGTWPSCSRQLGNSPFGVCDMAGNVREWVADWYSSSTYARKSVTDPTGSSSGEVKVQRGGAFDGDPWHVRTTVRVSRKPDSQEAQVGFRCAKSIPR